MYTLLKVAAQPASRGSVLEDWKNSLKPSQSLNLKLKSWCPTQIFVYLF